MSSKPKYSWDTCVFIAWLTEETDKPLADIQLVANEIDSDKAVLIVPVTIFTEMQRSKFTDEQWQKFDNFFERSNVIVANTTQTIAQRASQIRDRAETQGRKIKTGDATIIATAIVYRADAFHTFEPKLLNLNGSSVVDGLRITQPLAFDRQKGLPGLHF